MSQDESQTSVTPEGSGDPATPHSLPSSPLLRSAWFFAGVVVPFFCFLLSFPSRPTWQSSNLSAYAELLLAREPSFAQYPLLLYSMTCLALLMLRPARFWNSTFVRLGIYTGVLVAAEYWFLFQFVVDSQFASDATHVAVPAAISLAAVFIPWLLVRFLDFLARKGWSGIAWIVGFVLVFPLLVVSLWCSTSWALATYLAVSIHLLRDAATRRFQFSLAWLFLISGWLSVHLGAWRISFTLMLREYAALPLAPPPQCFVCTAIAKGHPRVVGSEEYLDPHGTAFRVNDQLRFLKGFELLLAHLSPQLHHMSRWLYDRVGPRLARVMVHPTLADLGYLTLKPAEWIARMCLAMAIPGEMDLVRSIYRTQRCSDGSRYTGPKKLDHDFRSK